MFKDRLQNKSDVFESFFRKLFFFVDANLVPPHPFLSVYHGCVNLRPLRFVFVAMWNADVPIVWLSPLISFHHQMHKSDGQCVPKKCHSSYVKPNTYLNKEIQMRDIQKSIHIDNCQWCLHSLYCCYSCAD